ncbi:MAG: helicase-related protein [Parvularculaceae bacterium]
MPRAKLRPHQITRETPVAGALVGVLGPTNTGKTHYAVERMLAHNTGMIGLPLRLLAREVYDKLVARRPPGEVALITGEEKIVPSSPKYWVATVEAMPLERRTEFLAIDEAQLAADPERGRIFTSRLLHARGARETLFLGSETMRPILKRLFAGIEIKSMERFSTLSYTGPRKVTRLPRRSAIVGFSADTVYAIAELVRRQRGGAAVVLAALSPRTRNAQAELYQSGEVEYLVATDAIGMGLNMDIDHVAFSTRRKFDGRGFRDLKPQELAQIAGRAGRHITDGGFGETTDCRAFDEADIAAIEEHRFDPVERLQWRSDDLDFGSIHALRLSLERASPREDLQRARADEDETAFARLASYQEIRERAAGVAATALLWDVCQVPDFRKVALDQHITLLNEIYDQLIDDGRIAEAWLAPKVERLDRIDGDIDAISQRIAYVRTWTYLSNRGGWVENGGYWQGRTRAIEDSLSDALHEKLTQRFVDRRTSVLLRKLKEDAPLLAGVTENGDVIVEGQFVGRLLGFEFIVDPRARGVEAKRVRFAAEKALTPVLAARAAALANAEENELEIRDDGVIWWRSSPVAELRKGPAPLRPDIAIRGLDAISPNLRTRVQDRLTAYVSARIEILLSDLIGLKRAQDDENALPGIARGIAFRISENFGAMSRSQFGDEMKQLGQDDRAKLRKLGLRFGEYTIFMPNLLKPAAARMLVLLWALWTNRKPGDFELPKPGLVSTPMTGPIVETIPHAYYYALGYRPSGERAVRIDMLERLAQLIRTARTGAKSREGFEATSQMMSLVGCSGEDFEAILRSLGYRKQTVKRAKAAPDEAASEPAAATPPEEASEPTTAEHESTDAPAASASVEGGTEAAAAAGEENQTPPVPALESTDAAAGAAADATVEPAKDQAPTEELSAALLAVETGDADTADAASEAELEEVVLWHHAPRRPPQTRRQEKNGDNRRGGAHSSAKAGDRKDARGGHGKPGGKKRDARGPNKGAPKGERRYSSQPPRRNREPDPNSPFAVLAALKSDMSSNGKSD